MSTIDEAFVKAYRKGQVSPTPQPVVEPAVWGPPPMAAPAAAPSPPTSVPRPHMRVAPPPGAREPDPAVAPKITVYHGPHSGPASPHARPRSLNRAATATQAPRAPSTQAPSVAAPAFEVERFTWPLIVEQLLLTAMADFATFGVELERRRRRGERTLLVTGCARGEGRTTLLLALARLAASRGMKVLLFDADRGHPWLAESLGIEPHVGWDDVLNGAQPLTEALIESVEERVTLLPLRSSLAGQGDGLRRFVADSLEELRQRHDLVLVDAGPLDHDAAALDVAMVLGGVPIDHALVVRDANVATAVSLEAVAHRLAAVGVDHWEVVDNFTTGSTR